MNAGAGGALGDGLALSIHNSGAGAGLRAADRYQVLVVGQRDCEAVVRLRQGDGGGLQGGGGALVMGQLRRIVHGEGAGAVSECRDLAVVLDDVTGVVSRQRQRRQRRGSGVVVRVVAVRYGPYAGVQEGVAVAVCNDEVAVIASVGEAQEAFLGDVCEQLHVLGIIDEHATVVGDGDATCRALAFGDGGGGCARGGGGAGAGLCILAGLGGLGAACGQGEGGYCAECAGAGEEKLTGHVHAPRLT